MPQYELDTKVDNGHGRLSTASSLSYFPRERKYVGRHRQCATIVAKQTFVCTGCRSVDGNAIRHRVVNECRLLTPPKSQHWVWKHFTVYAKEALVNIAVCILLIRVSGVSIYAFTDRYDDFFECTCFLYIYQC